MEEFYIKMCNHLNNLSNKLNKYNKHNKFNKKSKQLKNQQNKMVIHLQKFQFLISEKLLRIGFWNLKQQFLIII